MKNSLLIFLLLLASSFSEIHGGHGRKTYNEIMESVKHPERLVFDISSSPWFIDNQNEKMMEVIHGKYWDEIELRLSPAVLYSLEYSDSLGRGFIPLDVVLEYTGTAEQDWRHEPPFAETIMFEIGSRIGSSYIPTHLSGPSQNKTFLEIVQDNSAHTFVLIFSSRCECLGNNGEKWFQLLTALKSQYKNLRVGLEYSYRDYEVLYEELQYLRDIIDVAITTTDVSYHDFPLSYSRFNAKLRKTISDQADFLRSENPNRVNYISLSNVDSDISLPDELHQIYDYYLLQFSVFWLNGGGDTALILKSFNNSLAFGTGPEEIELGKRVSIRIGEEGMEQLGACEVKTLLDHISSSRFGSATILNTLGNYNRLTFENIDKCVLLNNVGCDEAKAENAVCNRPTGISYLPEIYLRYFVEWNRQPKLEEELINLTRIFDALPWKQFGLNPDEKRGETNIGKLPAHVTATCLLEFGDGFGNLKNESREFNQEEFIQNYWAPCKLLSIEPNTVIWKFDYGSIWSTLTLRRLLTAVEQKYKIFVRLFPHKSATFRISFQGLNRQDMLQSEGLYCHPKVLEFNEMVEEVINFAGFHNLTVEFGNAFGYLNKNYMGWSALETLGELDMNKTKFPVFVGRNYPDHFLLGSLPLDPCIAHTKQVPKMGIDMDPEYGGVTIDMAGMKNGIITADEMEVMLQFIFHKFSQLEVIPGNCEDLELVYTVLSRKRFIDKLANQTSQHMKLYLNIDQELKCVSVVANGLSDTLVKIKNMVLKPTGIHFQNLNSSLNFDDLNEIRKLQEHGILVGISLDDCVDEVNNNFSNLIKLQIFSQIDYLLCNINQRTRATNVIKANVAKYLDTTLYIKKYFQRMFPNASTELLFRLNTESSHLRQSMLEVGLKADEDLIFRKETSDFLKFFSDVGQYGRWNKLQFFMFPAFDSMDGGRFGWWKISNFEQLASTSVYTEKQAEYLGQETWRPEQEQDEHVSQNWLRVVLFGIAALVIVIFTLVIALLFVLHYKRKYSLLTRKEVDEFQFGKKYVSPDDRVSLGQVYDNLGFPQQYAIAKDRFELLDIIGQGEFGVVYNANLSDDTGSMVTRVAVKVPNSDCSRVCFRSMLSELKILCHVGEHRHVIGFVGAYVKEIGKGIVYIATEFCENGALQEYLRGIQLEEYAQVLNAPNTPTNYMSPNYLSVISNYDQVEMAVHVQTPNISELCRFAHEIAQGMDYISYKKIVHGDLATRNVLLDSDLQCKISDFGLSRKLYEYQEYVKKSSAPLPWRWMAVESLKRMEFTTKSDCWGYGVTIWEIFSLGRVPYPGLSWRTEFVDELEKGLRPSAPKYAPVEIYEKMRSCWDNDPDLRPSFKELSDYLGTLRDKEYTRILDE